MAVWRKSIFPVCPVCNSGGGYAVHATCPNIKKWFGKKGNLWIDITTGVEQCDACKQNWSIERARHDCVCGVIFMGGQIWLGMAEEIGKYKNTAWLQRIGVFKGNLTARVVGYSKCSFCGSWDRIVWEKAEKKARKIFSSPYAGICESCIRKYRGKWFNFGKKRGEKCYFCYKQGKEVDQLFSDNEKFICGECVDNFYKKYKSS